MRPKVGVFVCQLESKGGEDGVQVTTVLEVSRTKKGRSQETIGEHTLSDRLSYRRLPCPGEAIQPKDRRLLEVFRPRVDLIQDGLSSASEAASAVTVLVRSAASAAAVAEH